MMINFFILFLFLFGLIGFVIDVSCLMDSFFNPGVKE